MALSSNQLDKVTYIIGDNPVSVPMPTYSGFPTGCVLSLTYEFVLEAKTVDPNFSAVQELTSGDLPTFVKFDPAIGITINGLNYGESWSTY